MDTIYQDRLVSSVIRDTFVTITLNNLIQLMELLVKFVQLDITVTQRLISMKFHALLEPITLQLKEKL